MKSKLLLYFLVVALLASASGMAHMNRLDTTGRKDFFFRGTEYTKIFTKESGTPFIETAGMNTGWIDYFGSRYNDVSLQYDIEDDQLVSLDYSRAVRMQLVKQKVTAFGIGNRRFIRIAGQDLFFEQVYHGKHDVLIRWQKVFTRTGTEDGKYKLYKSYYISKGGVPVNIQSGKDLYSYFGKQGKELKEYLREQKIVFKKNTEKALVAAAGYADKNSWHGQ
jgi:hypothetical protein